MGNDLVRFIDGAIGRPTLVSGLSSGGVLAAWLSAYASPGQLRGAHYEDPPLFASEVSPPCGPSIRQAIGPLFALWSRYLGDQWSVGDWDAMGAAAPHELPALDGRAVRVDGGRRAAAEPEGIRPGVGARVLDRQRRRELRPRPDARRAVKVPVLLTHHFRKVDEASGLLMGALADVQAARVRELVTAAGQAVDYRSFPTMGHSMHGQDPKLFTDTLVGWAAALP